jgi:hypothetical protein
MKSIVNSIKGRIWHYTELKVRNRMSERVWLEVLPGVGTRSWLQTSLVTITLRRVLDEIES